MSRRRVRRRAAGAAGSDAPLRGGHEQVETWDGEEWRVRQVTGSAATKPYRCPGCEQVIPMNTPHVVAWPEEPGDRPDAGLAQRRHWHSGCWRARDRRRPAAY